MADRLIVKGAREQAVTGEQLHIAACGQATERQRHRAWSVAAQVDDVEAELADGDGVPASEQLIGCDGQRSGVQLVRGGRGAGGPGHLRERQPMVLVLVGGDDLRELRRVPLDQFEQDRGVVGGVDE